MRTKFYKWLAIAWLVVGGTFAAGALVKIPFIVMGSYDPVAHDGYSPDVLPWYYAGVFGMPLLCAATARAALKFANP